MTPILARVALGVAGVALIALGCAGTSQESLTPGERLFRSRCQSCHQLPPEASLSVDQWAEFLPEHADRAGLSEAEQRLLLAHLVAKR